MAGEGGECVKITGYRIGKRMKVALIGDAEGIASFLKQMEGDNGGSLSCFCKGNSRANIRDIQILLS